MMIVVAPTVTEEGLPAVVERVSGLVETHNGAVESFTYDSPWGRRRLAYPIQKFRDAFYVLYYFDMAPRSIDDLDRDIRLDEAIIRHLIVKYDPLTERTGDYGDDRDEDDEDENGVRARRADEEAPEDAETEADADDADEDEADADDADEDEADADDDSDDDDEDEDEDDEEDDE
jgi:small subunit ribosomal protein S6